MTMNRMGLKEGPKSRIKLMCSCLSSWTWSPLKRLSR